MTRDIKKLDQAAKGTEKKKRILKPAPFEDTLTLLKFLPFLNADDDDLISQANKIFKGYSSFKKPNFEELKKTQEKMVSVLKVAWNLQKGNKVLGTWLEESINVAPKYQVIWDSCEDRAMNEIHHNSIDVIDLVQIRLIFSQAVKGALDSSSDNAKFYINFCRHCGKLFKKEKKTDQVLCSNACKSAIYRDRKK
ncbi:MAG: hypothetical protein ACD_28C00221G0004 [uncultured bacterium]|nr:MAG: hypothetical protein ACD_28C00221G0004 [uncultured bacterium]